MNQDHLIWRNIYLRTLKANREKPINSRLREVYLNESYILQHFIRDEFSIWDPIDDEFVIEKNQKGRRFCFCTAIQGQYGESAAGIVDNSTSIFSTQEKEAHYDDYYRNFNGENFVNWFTNNLLPKLSHPS